MEDFFLANQIELLWTLITIIIVTVFRFIGKKTVRRIGRLSNFIEGRTLLVTKYVSVLFTFLGFGAIIFI